VLHHSMAPTMTLRALFAGLAGLTGWVSVRVWCLAARKHQNRWANSAGGLFGSAFSWRWLVLRIAVMLAGAA
jgi:hypothetical protein